MTEDGWLRLDPRVLLIDPVKVLKQIAVPAVIALVGLGSGERPFPWWAVPLVVVGAVAAGTVPWLTTRYRVTPTQFEQRRGLLSRQHLTAPLDRVRSVDLEASLLHRALGLTKVQVGTGVDDERITLDSLAVDRAADLRAFLLARRRQSTTQDVTAAVRTSPPAPSAQPPTQPPTQPGAHPGAQPEAQPGLPDGERELARIDWSWLRFAPFSLSRLVVVAGVLGAASQLVDELPVFDEEHLSDAWRWVTGFALVLVAVVIVVGSLATWLVISVTGFVAQWWNMRLTREGGSLHLVAGLFTTRSTSVEEKRVRGVQLAEPVLLRLVGGAELSTLSTGLEHGTTAILPPCPVDVARNVGGDVLGTPGPLSVALSAHGSAARRRSHVRHQWPTVALLAASSVLAVADVPPVEGWLPGWLPWTATAGAAVLGVLVAEQAYRHLGHSLTHSPAGHHLVAGSGELTRRRTVLEVDGIIGWVVRESFFQRRLGLATLVATTAAGSERVEVLDVPRTTAVAVADAATPGLIGEFVVA